MSFGLIIGNGESRLALDPSVYDKKDTWACNLAYKEFTPRNLVCCDKNMLTLAISEGASRNSQVWTRKMWASKIALQGIHFLPEDLPFPKESKHDIPLHWGSGTYAAYLACLSPHDILVFVGFDLWGTKDNKINNVYKGQHGYGPADSDAVGPQGWIYQLGRLMTHFPNKQFVFLNVPNWKPPEEWSKHENFFQDDLKQVNNLA